MIEFPAVSFRPHTMRVLQMSGGGYDENRDYVPATEEWSEPIPCRYEPNGQARTINLPDGTAYKYSFLVYLNVDPSLSIRYGDKISLTSQDALELGTFEVKGFHRGQLNMKIWV